MESRALALTAEGLASRGFPVLRFNFPYRESGRRIPDKALVLEECYRAVAARARELFAPCGLLLGGRSMGGRIASQIASVSPPQGLQGLVLLAYPLHPPGRPEKLRDAHLAGIQAPMLFVSGTRDTFAGKDLLEGVLERLPLARIHWLEGADHSFKTPRRPEAEVSEEVLAVVEDFMR